MAKLSDYNLNDPEFLKKYAGKAFQDEGGVLKYINPAGGIKDYTNPTFSMGYNANRGAKVYQSGGKTLYQYDPDRAGAIPDSPISAEQLAGAAPFGASDVMGLSEIDQKYLANKPTAPVDIGFMPRDVNESMEDYLVKKRSEEIRKTGKSNIEGGFMNSFANAQAQNQGIAPEYGTIEYANDVMKAPKYAKVGDVWTSAEGITYKMGKIGGSGILRWEPQNPTNPPSGVLDTLKAVSSSQTPFYTEGQPLTLPNGQKISPQDPNYEIYKKQMGIGLTKTETPQSDLDSGLALQKRVEETDKNLISNKDFVNAVFKSYHNRDANATELDKYAGLTVGEVIKQVKGGAPTKGLNAILQTNQPTAPAQPPAGVLDTLGGGGAENAPTGITGASGATGGAPATPDINAILTALGGMSGGNDYRQQLTDLISQMKTGQQSQLDYLKSQPSLTDTYAKLREQLGLPAQEAELAGVRGEVNDTETLLDNLEKDINSRISGKGVSEALRRRLLSSEGTPLREQLANLVKGQGQLEQGMTSSRQQLSDLIGLSKTEQERLADQAGIPVEQLSQLIPLITSAATYQSPQEQLAQQIAGNILSSQITGQQNTAQTIAEQEALKKAGLGSYYQSPEGTKYITVGNNVLAIDPNTGKSEVVYQGKEEIERSAPYKEWTDYVSTGGKLTFDQYMTMDANRKSGRTYAKAPAKASGGGGTTTAPFKQIETNLLSTIGSDGFVSPDDYALAKNDWIQAGGEPADFDTKFKGRRNPNNPYYNLTKASSSTTVNNNNQGPRFEDY